MHSINTRADAAPDTQPETAETVRQQAAEHRATAEAARERAATTLRLAQQAAAQLLAEAEARAQQLTTEATAADRAAAPLEERGNYLTHAGQLRARIADTEQTIVRLAQEQEQLQETTRQLGARLAELGEQRETTGALLAAARERGDVETVTDLRSRLTGVDEVVAVLQGQQQAARDRLTTVGDADGSGELNRAVSSRQARLAELRRVENTLDPERPEAAQDRLIEQLTGLAQHFAREQAGPRPTRTTLFTR